MLLVMLEGCHGCHFFHEKHPELPYITLPRDLAKDTLDTTEIRKALGLLGVDGYPVILTNDLKNIIPLESVGTIVRPLSSVDLPTNTPTLTAK